MTTVSIRLPDEILSEVRAGLKNLDKPEVGLK
jgi:hypothetical protein